MVITFHDHKAIARSRDVGLKFEIDLSFPPQFGTYAQPGQVNIYPTHPILVQNPFTADHLRTLARELNTIADIADGTICFPQSEEPRSSLPE